MDNFNFRNMQLAYQAVHDEVLCESMDELGFFDGIEEKYQPWDISRGNRPSPRDVAAKRQGKFTSSGQPIGNRIRGEQIRNVRSNMRLAISGTKPSQMGSGPIASGRFKSAAIRQRGGSPNTSPIQTVPGLRSYNQGVQSALTNIKKLQPNRMNPPGQRYGLGSTGLADEYQVYELVLEYLLDGGYTDTVEGAVSILENMSEDWLETIFEAEGSYGQTPKAKAAYNALRMKREVGRGKHGQSLNLVRRHLRRLASGPDVGHSGRQSPRPEPRPDDIPIRSKMTQDDRDIARQTGYYDPDDLYYGPLSDGPKGSLPKGKKLTRQRKTGVSK